MAAEMADVAARNGYSPTFWVVVCTRDRPRQLSRCLTSLSRLDYPFYEVTVVDNAPRDERSRAVALRQGAQYLIEPVPGLSRARNRGARACEAEIVAYLDDDAVAEPDWLTVLARDFGDPLVAAVAGAILPLRESGEVPILGTESVPPSSERGQRRVVDPETPGWFEIANFGAIGDGSNMAFRRNVFGDWAGFDENLGRGTILNGGEEHCAFFALIERGYRIVYDPDAVVRHPDPRTPEERHRRHLNLLATSAAYITYLAVQHPSCRGALARYLFDRLRAATRSGVANSPNKTSRIARRWSTLFAVLSGPWIYLRSRLSRTASPRQEPQSIRTASGTPQSECRSA
jgi:glycosyltransferase involved in cell wall biosynthesis